MAGLFLRLKLRLLRNALRTPSRAAFLLVGLVLGLLLTGFLAIGYQVLRDDPPVATAAGILLAVVLAIGWTTLPIAAFGVDETLDVSRLALLPIRRGPLLAGLLLAAALGVPALLTFLLLAAGAAAVTTTWAALPVAVVAVPLLTAMCLLLGRVVTSALSRLLRSRRGRDLAVLVGLGIVLAAQAPRLLAENVDEAGLLRIGDLLRWTPPGAGLSAVASASAGSWGPCLWELLYLAAFVGLLVGAWYVALGAALVVVDASTTPPRRRFTGLLSLLPDGRLGAVAAKDLRYAWRDPRLKLSWLQMMIFGLAVPAFTLWDSGRYAPPVAAMFSALLAASLGFNQFGPEGSGFWITVAATGSERQIRVDLAGRNLATAILSMLWILVSCTVLAVLVAPSVPAAVALSIGSGAAVLGAGLGVSVLASVLAPYPMPDQPTAAFAGPGAGRGCIAGLAWTLGAVVVTVLALPVALPALLSPSGWVALLVLLAGPAYGAALAWTGRRIAAAILLTRLPELLVAVTPDRT